MILTNLAYLAAEGESLGETMARAGLNTAMGIGIVFCALIDTCPVIVSERLPFPSFVVFRLKPPVDRAFFSSFFADLFSVLKNH